MANTTVYPFEGAGDATPIGIAGISTNQDGAMVITLSNNDTYSINLNHTHTGMTKMVVANEDALPEPANMDEDTIYAGLANGDVNIVYFGGHPFYGSLLTSPVLLRPSNGSLLNVGTVESGATSVEKNINLKGKNLTQSLTATITGTGYTFKGTQTTGVTVDSTTQLTISAAAANLSSGVDIVVVYTGSDDNAEGELEITSIAPDNISSECELIANESTYKDLAGVKFNGTQYLETDYYPNALTEFELECRFETNSNSFDNSVYRVFINTLPNSNPTKYFYSLITNTSKTTKIDIEVLVDSDAYDQVIASIPISNFLTDHSVYKYTVGSSNNSISFITGGTGTAYSKSILKKTSQMTNPMCLCGRSDSTRYFSYFDLTVYRLTIKENDVVVRNYVPKEYGGVSGLYDTINDTFLTSATSTELVGIPLI